MRKPNGYGSIKKLSGQRRRPFVFVVSDAGRQRSVEYFATQVEAEIFAADYNKIHHRHSLPGHQITLIELYHRWLPAHIADTGPSQSSLDSYKNAFRHLSDLHYEPVTKLHYTDYQRILDVMKRRGLSYSSLKKVRSLIALLEKYALKTEIITKSYAPLLSIGRNKPVRPHHTFSRQKINRLWKSVDYPGVDSVLILLYTGMRCGEMLQLQKADVHLRQRYIRITRSKTAAGIRADGHTTHDCRHTVATLLDNAGANETAKRRILGHAGGDVTERVYTHKGIRQLRKCIELLK